MRLFVAIDLPADLQSLYAEKIQTLADTRADVRWVAPGNLHVAVKFLGEATEEQAARFQARLQRAAAQVPAFPLELEGLAKMPDKGPVRIIMSHVISPDQRITKLHRLIDSAAGGMGLPMDTRVYVPHLTLGRVSTNHKLNRLVRLLEKHDADLMGKFVVENVVLYQSMLGAGEGGAPQYVPLVTAPLAAASNSREHPQSSQPAGRIATRDDNSFQ
jgi:RNA 2',3'-cyclic 3'-phosphodiesterase